MTIRPFLALLCGVTLFSSCALHRKAQAPLEEQQLISYRATSGGIVYDKDAYSYVATVGGPMELRDTTIAYRVLTDGSLTAMASDVGGLCVGGDVWVCDSVVRGSAHIDGAAQFYDSEVVGSLFVSKELIAGGVQFKTDVQVEGNVTVQKCTFEGHLEATADIVCLTNTQTKSICIKDCGPYWDKQIVRIRDCSVIEGDITFESGRGRVLIDDSSRFIGTLSGGNFLEPHTSP